LQVEQQEETGQVEVEELVDLELLFQVEQK
jgi:hypothetical protein